MEKIIEIDIAYEQDLCEKYNTKIVSNDLINYIINSIHHVKKSEKIKIIINNLTERQDCIILIKEVLKREYGKSYITYHKNNLIQIIYFLIGVIALILYSIIKYTIFKEIVLIGAWVLIWEMVELEIFSDVKEKKKRIILKKLLDSEFIEKKVKDNYNID